MGEGGRAERGGEEKGEGETLIYAVSSFEPAPNHNSKTIRLHMSRI